MKFETIKPTGTPEVKIPPLKTQKQVYVVIRTIPTNNQPNVVKNPCHPSYRGDSETNTSKLTRTCSQPEQIPTTRPGDPRMYSDAQVWHRPPRTRKDTQKRTGRSPPDQTSCSQAACVKKPRAPPFSREILHPQHEFRGSSNLATLTNTETPSPQRVHDAPREVVHPCISKGAKTTTPAGPLAS